MAFKVINRIYGDGSHTVNGPVPCGASERNTYVYRGAYDVYVNVFETFDDAQYFIDTELVE